MKRIWTENQKQLRKIRRANRSPEQVERDREKQRAYNRDPERAARARESQRRNSRTDKRRAYNRAYGIKSRYGLTTEQWEQMFEAQGRCCAICKSKDPGDKRGWHTDHCHGGLGVRGILCNSCNIGLGQFKDDLIRLKSAYDYLYSHVLKIAHRIGS